jgi:Bacterial TSP3 repeat
MKRLPLMRALLTLLVGFVVLTTATAQTSTDPNEGSRLTYDGLLGSYDFSWWGQPGRTYFFQHSDDLSTWEYLPLIESGTDGPLSWGFTSTADRLFLRLRFSDIPSYAPFTDDFDGDRVTNYDELIQGTDPLASTDIDLDGLPDDWEKWQFGNLNSNGNGDLDADGLSNLAEYSQQTNPNSSDSDFDGINDGDEVNVYGTNPLNSDSDGDKLPDYWEVQNGLAPVNASDADQTAAGGGMTNLQHYQSGSDPNAAPPPPTVAADTATLDQNADTILYPIDDSQLLLTNGNFNVPSLASNNTWNTFSGIPGWTAKSGNLIELQNFSSITTEGQFCELDSHWPTADHSGPSDHGIKQTVNLARGRYFLVFDYRGRRSGDDSFVVTLNTSSSGSAGDTVLLTKNAATTTEWKRAFTAFDVSGGNPNLTEFSITLSFNTADSLNNYANSFGAYIRNVILGPVAFKELTPNSGFDGISTPNWLMVPVNGSNSAKAITNATASINYTFAIKPEFAHELVTPTNTSVSPQTITVNGVDPGSFTSVDVGVGGTNITNVAKLKVSVKRYQVKTVAIHAVTQKYTTPMALGPNEGIPNVTCIQVKPGGGSQIPWTTPGGDDKAVGNTIHTGANGVCETTADPQYEIQMIHFGQGIHRNIVPTNVPSVADLQAYLNTVFGLQSNTYFSVTRSDFEVNYDLGKNKMLNVGPVQGIQTSEEKAILSKATSGVDSNIYFVGDFCVTSLKIGEPPSHNAVGAANSLRRFAFVRNAAFPHMLNTTGHEIGHLFGLNHADEQKLGNGQNNPTFHLGSDSKKRLMYFETQAVDPTFLFKPEWDIVNKDS